MRLLRKASGTPDGFGLIVLSHLCDQMILDNQADATSVGSGLRRSGEGPLRVSPRLPAQHYRLFAGVGSAVVNASFQIDQDRREAVAHSPRSHNVHLVPLVA